MTSSPSTTRSGVGRNQRRRVEEGCPCHEYSRIRPQEAVENTRRKPPPAEVPKTLGRDMIAPPLATASLRQTDYAGSIRAGRTAAAFAGSIRQIIKDMAAIAGWTIVGEASNGQETIDC